MNPDSFLQKLKPGIPKKYLLFVAGILWTFGGGMLIFRGITFLFQSYDMLWLRLGFSIIVGILFFIIVFSKVSLKHSLRIIHLKVEKPCFFSFFNWSGYLMMIIMISTGVFVRKSGFIPLDYLSEFYIIMGIPLLLSAFRFYFYGFNFNKSRTLGSIQNKE